MIINVKTSSGNYDITLKRNALNEVNSILNIKGKALIVTDSGVPEIYAKTVAGQIENSVIYTFPQGEQSKNFEVYSALLKALAENKFDRKDCVIAVGGGVVGDMAGFTAATYMRGISFYNIPTTLLSQVDSSIGGKTAIDFLGYKNLVGAFYQPKAVIIDPNVLNTLTDRQFNNGLSESIKMAATSNSELFELLENNNAKDIIDTVIEKSLLIKKAVVEEDEKETGLRKVLNFGHTVGHAIETVTGLNELYHGECVALGMMFMSSGEPKERIAELLIKNNLPIKTSFDREAVFEALQHDKKSAGSGVNAVFVDKIGEFSFKFLEFSEIYKLLKGVS
ncbi:MAG: 3-dehydroquinate synthase [Ruminococcaceae bacterium]|nr:3-dehydroquinate synthase [Oscillospiraceae bacterium]